MGSERVKHPLEAPHAMHRCKHWNTLRAKTEGKDDPHAHNTLTFPESSRAGDKISAIKHAQAQSTARMRSRQRWEQHAAHKGAIKRLHCIALPAVSMRAHTRLFATAAVSGSWVISQACQGGQGSAGWGDGNHAYQALRSRGSALMICFPMAS